MQTCLTLYCIFAINLCESVHYISNVMLGLHTGNLYLDLSCVCLLAKISDRYFYCPPQFSSPQSTDGHYLYMSFTDPKVDEVVIVEPREDRLYIFLHIIICITVMYIQFWSIRCAQNRWLKTCFQHSRLKADHSPRLEHGPMAL